MNRLSAQLNRLRGGSGTGGSRREVARLRNALAKGGCATHSPAVASVGRTLCVRTCDGYYFPISWRARASRVKIDAEACQSMYAAAGQAELFVQKSRSVDDARSLAGARYGDQPFAFMYREEYRPACVDELRAGIKALAERYYGALADGLGKTPPTGGQLVAIPRVRPPRSEDPETLANLAGKFQPAPVGGIVAAIVAKASAIRMVGPAYYAKLFDPRIQSAPPQPASPSFSLIGSAAAAEAIEPLADGPLRPRATQPTTRP